MTRSPSSKKHGTNLPRLLLLLALLAAAPGLKAQSFTNLYQFSVPSAAYINADGATPYGALVLSGNKLYGTTRLGGTNAGGTVFAIDTDGTGFTNLYNFTGGSNGANPVTGLVLAGNTLYGVTYFGGGSGYGVVFKINTDGSSYTNLHSFTSEAINGSIYTNSDGVYPGAALILSGGTLFGTASSGGWYGYGTVFRVNTDGSGFSTLYNFTNGADGSYPAGRLILSGSTLYGAASGGGSNNNGALFSLNTNGTGFKPIYAFSPATYNGSANTNNDGYHPNGGLTLSGNTLYGTASYGGTLGVGTVFKVDTNGFNFSVISSNVTYPGADLVLLGNIVYGTSGGGSYSHGAIFSINTNGSNFTNLYNFTGGTDGLAPNSLILSGKTLYGTTVEAGNFGPPPLLQNGFGTIYSFTLGASALTVTTTSLPSGSVGTAYSQMLNASGGQPPYVWTNIAGTLPSGLTLATNGSLSGTPTGNGTFNFVVQVTDLFSTTATQSLALQIITPDTTKPTLQITNLTAGQRWSNAVFTVAGIAGDNVQVSNVWVQLNGGSLMSATSGNVWTNWSAALNLSAGSNTVAAFAVDTSGNLSITNQLTFDFVATNQLGVRTLGLGTVSPNYSNAWLEIGQKYSITSSPASNFAATNWVVSTNWSGGTTNNGNVLQFTMASNLTLQATFFDLLRPTNTITAPTAGQHMTNALATVIGTTKDNWKISGVWCQLNSGDWNLSSTTNSWTNWTTTLKLITGTNTVKAYAVDGSGNFSTTNSVSVLSSNTFKLLLAFTNATPLKTNGLTFQLQLSTGLIGHIQFSTNLNSWTVLTNFVGTNANLNFRDPAATNSVHRFYRAVIP
jgi:uncharacterized repeat protein (TIGR03803 family)